ncbi:MAG: hypothetical protein EPN82_13275 [Bacteroidetes bacterium]|nr:MAG: hypothetical protein EPN82_13275 [Bacteroidota bacterium]
MSNNTCLNVELRGIGNNYGKTIQARLVSVMVELPEGDIAEYGVIDGFEIEGTRDVDFIPEYTDYQLNLDSLKFAQSVISDKDED